SNYASFCMKPSKNEVKNVVKSWSHTVLPPLLRWILRSWQDERVILAMDATYLKDRFIILAISVVVNGCAIPVAWHVRRADACGEWNPIWYQLFDQIAPILSDYEVYMLADSGLRSKAVFERVKAYGWHCVMRI